MQAEAIQTGSQWRVAIYASVVLWLASVAGNIALYAVHPTGHWPALETIEALQAASLIPIALYLHGRNRSGLSLAITVIGIAAIIGQTFIGIGFATGAIAFGQGPIGGPAYIGTFLVLFAWLFAANAAAWRRRSLPQPLAVLGLVTAATATLLYPVWAIGLAGTVGKDPTSL